MRIIKLTSIIIFSLFLSFCGDKLEREVVTKYFDGLPKKVQYYRWNGNTKEIVREETLLPGGGTAEENELKDGKKHGTCISRHAENGEKWVEQEYKNGLKDGKITVWYKSGEKQYSGYYKQNVPDGKWTFWNAKGEKEKEIIYENGKIKK